MMMRYLSTRSFLDPLRARVWSGLGLVYWPLGILHPFLAHGAVKLTPRFHEAWTAHYRIAHVPRMGSAALLAPNALHAAQFFQCGSRQVDYIIGHRTTR